MNFMQEYEKWLTSSALSPAEKAELEAFASLVRPFVERVEVRGV